MSKTPLQIIDGVIGLFSDPSRWVQGSFATTAPSEIDGFAEDVSSHDEEAVCFCLQGAIDHVAESSLFQGCETGTVLRNRYPVEVVVAEAFVQELNAIGFDFQPFGGNAVSEECSDTIYARYGAMTHWNDNEDRTIGEVVDLCRAVKKRLETAKIDNGA